MPALMIVGILIALEAIGYYLFFRRLKPWDQAIERGTDSGSFIVDSRNYGKVLAVLRAQSKKSSVALGLALFLQIGTMIFFAPQVWSILDLVPYVDNTGTLTPPEGMIALCLAFSFCLYLLGLLPFYFVFGNRFNLTIVTTEGVAHKSPWLGRVFFLSWGDITSVTFPNFITTNNFLLKGEGGKMSVNCLYVGLDVFAKTLMEKVPRKKWTGVEDKLEQALKGPFF